MIAEIDDVHTLSICELAWTYHRWRWSIVPLGVGKKTATEKWKRWQEVRPPDHWVKTNWPAKSKRNIGIICGKVSGGLIVRDFDDASDYHSWAEAFPGLAKRLPTVRTRRGYHIYLRDAQEITVSVDLRPQHGIDGEVKGDGCYVVAAGSTVSFDKDGNPIEPFTYHWTIPPDIVVGMPVIPMVSLMESGLVPETLHSTTSNTQHSQHNQAFSGIGDDRQQVDGIVSLVDRHSIDGPGQRNAALWRLALDLRANHRSLSDDVTEAVLAAWLERNGHHCTTPDRLVNWSEFSSMVDRVDGGRAFLSALPTMFDQTSTPSWVQHLRGGEKLKRIARVIVAADRLADGGPFFLGLRSIARIAADMTAPTARAGVRHLIDKEIVRLVEPGESHLGGKANVYQLLIDDDGGVR